MFRGQGGWAWSWWRDLREEGRVQTLDHCRVAKSRARQTAEDREGSTVYPKPCTELQVVAIMALHLSLLLLRLLHAMKFWCFWPRFEIVPGLASLS